MRPLSFHASSDRPTTISPVTVPWTPLDDYIAAVTGGEFSHFPRAPRIPRSLFPEAP